MSEGCAQSEDYIPPKDIQWIVQADFDNRPDTLSWNRPQRTLVHAMSEAWAAAEAGATEIRIRPYPPKEKS